MQQGVHLSNRKGQLLPVATEPLRGLAQITGLTMILKMLQMGKNRILPHLYHPGNHRHLIVRFSLTLLNRDGPFRTMTDTCPQSITHQLTDQPRLTVNDLQGPFMTIGYTNPASIALILINSNDFPQHILSFITGQKYH
jgi:hypothetical protein